MGLMNATNFTEWQESHSVRLQYGDGLFFYRRGPALWVDKQTRTHDRRCGWHRESIDCFDCGRSHAAIFSRERIIRFSKRFRREAERFAG